MRMMPTDVGLITFGDDRSLVQVVPDDVKKLWNEWALRELILISLLSQMVLSFLGNLRKYNPRTRIRITLWIAYLLSNAVASAALGAITQSTLDVCSTSRPLKLNTSELMYFWAPFLLLHLGGPDTITGYSLQDNELWLRHLFELSAQFTVALYILLLSWPGCSHLPLLSTLIYVAGFIKCFERIQALRLANTDHLRDSMLGPPDPGPDYPKFVDDLKLKRSQGCHVEVEEVSEAPLPPNDYAYPEDHGKVVSEAYYLFQKFKRLLVDLILTFEDRDSSRSFFRHLTSAEAFYVIEIELGFAFDMLYTKANAVYTSRGIILRVISISLILLVLVGFSFVCDVNNYRVIDLAITWLLIVSAVAMEIFNVIALLRSDWTDHWLSRHKNTRNVLRLPFLKQPNKLRWSNSIAQLDLLSVALEEKPAQFLQVQKLIKIDQYREKHRYKTYSEVSNNLKELIYSQFHKFIYSSSDPRELCTHKGSFSLRGNDCNALLWSITDVEFDQSILLWHIATTLLYYSDVDSNDEVNMNVHMKESKHISDYMLYLLMMYPVMLPIGIGMIRCRDTCAEMMRFFKDKCQVNTKVNACKKLLEVDCREVLPSKVKGDRCKSELFDACRLVLMLKTMEHDRMWKVTFEVWVEIMAYAATHCRGAQHEQQLRKGGEFLTHVWLLMAHLGITEQFQVSQGHARARLKVT